LGDVDLMELQGLLSILPAVLQRVVYLPVDRILHTRYARPAHIEFTPVQKDLLPEKYDILKEYSYDRRPTLDVLSQVEKFEPLDTGNETTGLVYTSGTVMADVMSQVRISEFVGYTMLAETPLVYLALREWATQYDYDEERALAVIKRWRDLVLVRVTDAYPESLLWDLRRRALYLESQGWVALSETTLDLGGLEIYDEVAETFQMSTVTVPYDLDLRFYQARPSRTMSASGYFDPRDWLQASVARIYQGQLPLVRVTGTWTIRMPLQDTEIYKVAYAAQRAYESLIKANALLAVYASEVLVLPDLSIQVPVYDVEEQVEFTRHVEATLQQSENLEGVRCKDLSHCQAALEKTKEQAPHTYPLIVSIGNQYALVSNGPLSTPTDAQDYQKYLKRATKPQVSPSPPQINPLKGEVVEISYPEQESKTVLQVQLPNGRQIDLMTIEKDSASKERLLQVVKDLWREGWFLTPWAKGQWQKKNRLSSYLLRNIHTPEDQKELQRLTAVPKRDLQPRLLPAPAIDIASRIKDMGITKGLKSRRKLLQAP
jgi:hypothetical protein